MPCPHAIAPHSAARDVSWPLHARLGGALGLVLALAGCDIPGLGPDPAELKFEADSKATGAACRHALRGIEDCHRLNPKASKTAVYEGWREMDAYMRDNKIEGQKPSVASAPPAPTDEVLDEADDPPKKTKAKH